MSNQETNLQKDLLEAWKKGWNSYVGGFTSDGSAIVEIFTQLGLIAKVNLDEEEGYMRIKNAIALVAKHCSSHRDFSTKNISYIQKALQTILLEMSANKKIQLKYDQKQQRINEKKEHEKLMSESERQAKEWVEKNWTPELEESYQRDMKIIREGGNPWGGAFLTKEQIYE